MKKILRWLFFIPLSILAGGISYYLTYTFFWWIIPEIWILAKSVETSALLSATYTLLAVGSLICPNRKVGATVLSGIILATTIASVVSIFLGYYPSGWDVWDFSAFAVQCILIIIMAIAPVVLMDTEE